jgi:hypothetical protein
MAGAETEGSGRHSGAGGAKPAEKFDILIGASFEE